MLLLPSRPNAPSVAASIHAPTPGPSTTKDKGKQKTQSPDAFQEFAFPTGQQGFQDLRTSLLHLQAPLWDALSIASMENQQDVSLSMLHLKNLDNWLNFLLNVTNKAEKSVNFCQAVVQLPPYPALGLAWTALANNSTTIHIASSKVVHSLVNSITLINVNKGGSGDCVPVPTLPGIHSLQQIVIRP